MVVIDGFLENILECFVRGFGQAIRLWVVWCTHLVDRGVMVGEPIDYDIQKMASLVVDKFDGVIKSAPYVLI